MKISGGTAGSLLTFVAEVTLAIIFAARVTPETEQIGGTAAVSSIVLVNLFNPKTLTYLIFLLDFFFPVGRNVMPSHLLFAACSVSLQSDQSDMRAQCSLICRINL